MAEFICRLGTPSGEVMTRVIEASGAGEAKTRLEGEGFRVFNVASAEKGLSAMMPFGTSRKNRVKPNDFLLFNQQLSALLRAGIPVLQSINLLKNRSASSTLRDILIDVEDKSLTRLTDFLAAHRAGYVKQYSDRNRRVRIAEKSNFLLLIVVKNLKSVFGQT